MNFKFHNENMPNANSLVMYRVNKNGKLINTICAVIDIKDDTMVLLGLDNNAMYTANKLDDWIQLSVYDLKSLREAYNFIILNAPNNNLPDNVNNEKDNKNKIIVYVKNKYQKFADKFKINSK